MTEKKIAKLDFIKIKNFSASKYTININTGTNYTAFFEREKTPIEWERKLQVIYLIKLVFSIKNSYKSTIKNI